SCGRTARGAPARLPRSSKKSLRARFPSRKPRPPRRLPKQRPSRRLSSAAVALSSGQKLLRFDRKLGARLVAGTDEAGRGSLAGPLVVAGVLLDYGCLRDHKVRPLALLNDSKQVSPERREALFRAVL